MSCIRHSTPTLAPSLSDISAADLESSVKALFPSLPLTCLNTELLTFYRHHQFFFNIRELILPKKINTCISEPVSLSIVSNAVFVAKQLTDAWRYVETWEAGEDNTTHLEAVGHPGGCRWTLATWWVGSRSLDAQRKQPYLQLCASEWVYLWPLN